jgi:hypothetical protein
LQEFYPIECAKSVLDEVIKENKSITPSVCQSSVNICLESRDRADETGAESLIAETFELPILMES